MEKRARARVENSSPHTLLSCVLVTGGLPLGAWEHCPDLEMTVSKPLIWSRKRAPVMLRKGTLWKKHYGKGFGWPCIQQGINKVQAVGREGDDSGLLGMRCLLQPCCPALESPLLTMRL